MSDEKRSVGIVGTGWVGASVAISTLHLGIADELVLCDARGDVAEGEAMDLAHGSSFYPSAEVRSGDLDDVLSTDILVLCAGRGVGDRKSRVWICSRTTPTLRPESLNVSSRIRGSCSSWPIRSTC